MRKNEVQILKVSAITDLSDIKTSVYEYLQMDHAVILDSIGEKATYIALRAVIFAQRQFPENVQIVTRPGMVIVQTKEGERKAVRLTLELKAS